MLLNNVIQHSVNETAKSNEAVQTSNKNTKVVLRLSFHHLDFSKYTFNVLSVSKFIVLLYPLHHYIFWLGHCSSSLNMSVEVGSLHCMLWNG